MYEKFFRLNRKPFRTNPKGAEVFVGPQTARIVQSMKSALVGSDTVVAVSGAAGIGKSTLVTRSLDGFTKNLNVLHMPRARLKHDEVLDFLLTHLKVEAPPASTIRRFLLCRDVVARLSQAGQGLCIVVDDAERIGEDALVELEALTCADGQDAHGARIVLQGSDNLRELLRTPALSRLAQRTRLRFHVEPLGKGELVAYLKHALRLAGGDYDQLFDSDVVQSLHELSGGVPRMVNNLVDALLNSAAEQKRSRVDAAFLARLAHDQFGLDCDMPVPTPAAPAVPPAPATLLSKRQYDAGNAPELIQDTLPDLEQLAPELANPRDDVDESAEIPTLFSSTRMEAPCPASAPPAASTPAERSITVNNTETARSTVPDTTTVPAAAKPAAAPQGAAASLRPSEYAQAVVAPAAAGTAVAGDDVPAWDKDPTLAELRPDLEALEMAMAEFSREEPVRPVATDDDPEIELKDPTLAGVPAITLDMAISQKIAEATEALRKHDQTIAEEELSAAPAVEKKKAGSNGKAAAAPAVRPDETRADELKEVAAGIARAKSLEDVDDRMAETLFGEEFSAIAAAVAANAPSLASEARDAPQDTLQLERESDQRPADEGESFEATMEREFMEVYGADAIEVSLQGDMPRGGLDLSASQRLATVRALNAERKLSESARLRTAKTKSGSAAANRIVPSQSIEEQISTSLTQTLKALNTRPANDDDDDDNPRSGFFSRFRRH